MREERDYLEPPVYVHTCKYLGWDRGTRHATVTRTLKKKERAPGPADEYEGALARLCCVTLLVLSCYFPDLDLALVKVVSPVGGKRNKFRFAIIVCIPNGQLCGIAIGQFTIPNLAECLAIPLVCADGN